MCNTGFKALARRLCVGHAHSYPVQWNCPVEVFGTTIKPGQLIHADKHGFLVIPDEDQESLLEASRFMDSNECKTLIPAARNTTDLSMEEILQQIDHASEQFGKNVSEKFTRQGEW
jgi:regulator of RNase E activity RraA